MLYVVEMNTGERFLLACNMSEASASISVSWHGERELVTTPYQTADARHRLYEAALLAANWEGENDETGQPYTLADVVEVFPVRSHMAPIT